MPAHLGGTVAEVVENLFSGRKHHFVLVRGNVDGMVLRQLHAARGACSHKRIGGQRRGVRLLKKKTRTFLSQAKFPTRSFMKGVILVRRVKRQETVSFRNDTNYYT